MIYTLSKTSSIANHFIAEMRDEVKQKDRLRFRRNMERLGEIMAYEISKSFSYADQNIHTPLGVSRVSLLIEKPILITILRAGSPYFQGFLNYFDSSDAGFIGAYRKESSENDSIEIESNYLAAPDLQGKVVILIDPMIATGRSIVQSIRLLTENHGIPSKIIVAGIIGSTDGCNYVHDTLKNIDLYLVSIDEELNQKSYIVPGLGDAGDLSFGLKI